MFCFYTCREKKEKKTTLLPIGKKDVRKDFFTKLSFEWSWMD